MDFLYLCVEQNNKKIMGNYSGSDLSEDFKKFFHKERKRITKILLNKGCTDIKIEYGFYYFSGFFTSPSGQVYYFSCSDVRHFPYTQLLIRTAKNYKDYTGGANQYCRVDNASLENFKLI